MTEKILAAYYGDGAYNKHRFNGEDIKKLTHVNWAFAVIKDGRVVGDHLKNISHLHEFKALNPNLKTLISIGGWGAGGFSEAASTREGRELFVKTAIEVMQRFDFDGIDIDWEYPGIPAAGIGASKNDRENFSELLRICREKLDVLGAKDNRHYLLTIAVGAYSRCLEHLDVELIAQKYLDFINIMTYDLASGMKLTHHHTGLYGPKEYERISCATRAVKMYVEAGAPLEKLVIGGAFYARKWSGVPNVNNGLYQEAETGGIQTIDYTELHKDYIDKQGYKRYWDDEAQAPIFLMVNLSYPTMTPSPSLQRQNM